MYTSNMQRQCLICHQDCNHVVSLFHLLYASPICYSCLLNFERVHKSYQLAGYPIFILYKYNHFFKDLLFQYKGQYDIVLKDVFLCTIQKKLQQRYHDYLVVIIPSSKQDNERRGFCPNEQIVTTFSKHIFNGLYKAKPYKQTEQKDRQGIKKILRLQDGQKLTNRKILLFDDVITSGNTLLAAIALIEQYHPQTIEILVLASKQIDTLFSKIR